MIYILCIYIYVHNLFIFIFKYLFLFIYKSLNVNVSYVSLIQYIDLPNLMALLCISVVSSRGHWFSPKLLVMNPFSIQLAEVFKPNTSNSADTKFSKLYDNMRCNKTRLDKKS